MFLEGLKVYELQRFYDNRGYFCEVFKRSKYPDLPEFVQDNHSKSNYGVIRGLHYQWNPKMGKLMRVTRGCAQLVAVDIRWNSPTYGLHHSIIATPENGIMVYAPAGYARGFLALANDTEVQYKCTGEYTTTGQEGAIYPFDQELNIKWAIKKDSVIISQKDASAMDFAAFKIVNEDHKYFDYQEK